MHLNNYTDYSISGTVEALTDIGFDQSDSSKYIPNYSFIGMNLSAVKLQNAINSESNTDDKRLLEEVLSGDDTFLSKYNINSKIFIPQQEMMFFTVMLEMIPLDPEKEMILLTVVLETILFIFWAQQITIIYPIIYPLIHLRSQRQMDLLTIKP